MMVKDTNGTEFNAATNGKANAGLTLGIIGTGLAALSGGVLGSNGILGGNAPCQNVTQEKYYEDTIKNMKDFFGYAQGISDRLCNLENRVSVDETAISKDFAYLNEENRWQNKFYDERFRYTDLLEQCRINDATCKCIKGEVYASPSSLADPYVGRRMMISTYSPCCDGYNGWNYYGWNNGCGC